MRRYIDRVIEAENSTITVDGIKCNITVDIELSTHAKVFIHGSKAVYLLKVTLNKNTDIINQVTKEVREFFRNIKSSIIDPTDYIIKHK